MPASAARVEANRRNAALSTGPKTPEGKERSRRNGLKHGLSGSGVVLADEEAVEVNRIAEEFQADLAPRSSVGRFLVRQVALLAVRMERCAKQEGAAIALRVRHAVEDFDRERLDRANRLLETIAEDPRAHVRNLRRSPEGVEALIEAWQGLRDALARSPQPTWTAWHHERITHLTGQRVDDIGTTEIGDLSKATWDDFGDPSDPQVDPPAAVDEARRAEARTRLLGRIDAEIAGLEEHYETLDFETLAIDRVTAPDRALFDPSREATLARRYESEASRYFYKALKQLDEVEAAAAERAEVAATPAEESPCIPLGSSRERPTPAPREPRPAPGHCRPTSDAPSLEPVGRPQGRGWGPLGSA